MSIRIETKKLKRTGIVYTTAEIMENPAPVVVDYKDGNYGVIFCGDNGSLTASISKHHAEELITKLSEVVKGNNNESR